MITKLRPTAAVLVLPCLQVEKLPAGNQAGLWGSQLPAVWSFMLAARQPLAEVLHWW